MTLDSGFFLVFFIETKGVNFRENNEDLDEDEQDEMDEDGDIFEFKETYDWAAYDEEGEEQDYCPEEENANVYDYTAWVQRKDDQNGSIFSGMVGPEGISAWAVAGILASVAAIGAVEHTEVQNTNVIYIKELLIAMLVLLVFMGCVSLAVCYKNIRYLGTIQVVRHQRGGWVGSENGNF